MDYCDKRVAGFAQRRRQWLEMQGVLTAGGAAIQQIPGGSAGSPTRKWWDGAWCDCVFVALVVMVFALFCWRFPCL
jgi:hypothetical protein